MKFKRNTAKESSESASKEKSVPTGSDNNGKKRKSVVSYVVIVALALIMLGLVGGIIAAAVIFAYKPASDGNTNIFISIASLLITLLTLVIPLTSYTLNKKEVEIISEDIDKKIESGEQNTKNAIEANDKKVSNAVDEFNRIKTDFDSRYADLAESIVNGFSVDENDRDNSETKVNIGYINAMLCYDRGNYGDCKNKIREVWIKLLNLLKCDESKEKIGVDIECDNKFALLTYKVFNLYRHVAGRTRDFENVILAVRETMSCVKNLPYGKNSKVYVVLNYIMARMEIDTIEKSGDISKVQDDNKIVEFINDSYAYCEMINSVEKCDERQKRFLICSIMARVYQIATRYSTNEKTSDKTHKKDIYSGLSNLYVCEACRILLHEGWKLELNVSEIDKVLYNGCRFSVAKTLEKLSYNTVGKKKEVGPAEQPKLMSKAELLEKAVNQLHIKSKYLEQFDIDVEVLSYKDDLLEKAKSLLEKLIKEKRDPKYYLELSEIHKARKEWPDSEKAARYGYSLSPCDPLLAAQCAHIGLHNYLASGKLNDFYLNRTYECIDNAYFTYLREKELQDNNQERVNIKFLYIPSLFAVIKALSYDLNKKESTEEKNIKSYFDEIDGYVRESFAGVPTFANSVPNYMRALVAYYEFYNKITNTNVKKECIRGMVYICMKYWSNRTLWFSGDTDFYSDTYKISEMCLTCYKIYMPGATLKLIRNDEGIITHVINENGTRFTFHEFIQQFTGDLSKESIEDLFFARMFDRAFDDVQKQFIEQISELIDGACAEGDVRVDGGQRLYLKVI